MLQQRDARAGPQDGDVDQVVGRVSLVHLAAAAEGAGAGDDDLPGPPVEQRAPVDADAAAQRLRAQAGAQRADGVGQRPERALERARAMGGDDRQPDARRVEKRAVAGAQQVDGPLPPAVRGERARLADVERDVHCAREVVGRARRHDGQRQALGRRGHRHRADRAVAAGDHEAVGMLRRGRAGRRLDGPLGRPVRGGPGVEGVDAHRRARPAQQICDLGGIGALARRGVRHEGEAHGRASCP